MIAISCPRLSELKSSGPLNDGTERQAPNHGGSVKSLVAVVVLGSAMFLTGCNGNGLAHENYSAKNMLVTRDALISTFANCLLPGYQPAFSASRNSSYAGHSANCRLR
jgi:hypothetical protein